MIEILQDNDDAGKKGADKIAKALHDEFGGEPRVAQWDESLPKGFDPKADDENLTKTKEAISKAIPYKPVIETEGEILNMTDFLKQEYPDDKMIVQHMIQENQISILAGDCWHVSESEVNVEDIIKVMHENVETARRIIVETLRNLPPDFPNSQQDALKFALITEKSKIPQKTRSDLDLLLSKYLD